ncbi:MAG: 30S ribosome-binding factor RbfA [Desulfatibacillaceae bacterium]
MKTTGRAARVAEKIQREVADILTKKVRDPRLELATVTGVKVTSDLKLARIYYCAHGDEERKDEVRSAIASAQGFVKRELAQRLKLKYMPELEFYYDESVDYAQRIDSILDDLRKERGGEGEDGPE